MGICTSPTCRFVFVGALLLVALGAAATPLPQDGRTLDARGVAAVGGAFLGGAIGPVWAWLSRKRAVEQSAQQGAEKGAAEGALLAIAGVLQRLNTQDEAREKQDRILDELKAAGARRDRILETLTSNQEALRAGLERLGVITGGAIQRLDELHVSINGTGTTGRRPIPEGVR